MNDPLKEYLKVRYPFHHHPEVFNRMNMAVDVVDAFKAGMLAAQDIILECQIESGACNATLCLVSDRLKVRAGEISAP